MIQRAAYDGWYCDGTPNGQSVRLITNHHLVFNGAIVPLPGQNVLQVRIAPDGSRFAGIGHRDDQAWQWDWRAWTQHGLAFGPRSVMYGPTGDLLTISGPGTEAGSQGMRYVSDAGAVVYSHETYADPARGVWEYTERGDVVVGQGGSTVHGEDPCVAIVDGVKRLVEPGTCRFINVYRTGDRLSLAFVREDTGQAVLMSFDRADLADMPVVVAPSAAVSASVSPSASRSYSRSASESASASASPAPPSGGFRRARRLGG